MNGLEKYGEHKRSPIEEALIRQGLERATLNTLFFGLRAKTPEEKQYYLIAVRLIQEIATTLAALKGGVPCSREAKEIEFLKELL